jgi:hypothetical protein
MNPVENARTRPLRRVPEVKEEVAAEADTRDVVWEGELLCLLCTLESWRNRLNNYCLGNQAVPALDAMLVMVREVVAFAGVHLSASSNIRMANLRGRVEEFTGVALGLRQRLRKTTLRKLLDLLGRAGEETDPHLQFVDAARTLLEVLLGYFDLFTDSFHTKSGARGWHEAQQAFLGDLGGLVEQLEP